MNNQKGIVWIPILIMVGSVIVFSAMAYLVWTKNTRSTQNTDLTKPLVEHVVKNVNANVNEETIDYKALAQADLAAKWLTYTNDVYGFTLEYPSTWKNQPSLLFRPGSDGEIASGSPTVYVSFLPNPEKKTLGQLLDADYEECVASPGGSEEICINSKVISTWTSSTLSGHTVLRSGLLHLAAGSPSSVIEKDFLYVKTDEGYIVLNSFPEEFELVVDRIFSSLRFIDATKTWKVFESKELGLSFRYPSQYGNAVLKNGNSEVGKRLSITFSDAADLTFGGISADWSAGIEGYFLITQGYVFDQGKYYFFHTSGKGYKNYELAPRKVLTVDGVRILVVDQDSFIAERKKAKAIEQGDESNLYLLGPGIHGIGALVNFTKKSDFRGMAVWDKETALLPLTTFEKIIATFQFTK